jgi:hypothetical protein
MPRAPGGVVEWLMAPVLKTGEPKGSVGSNPTPSVFTSFPLQATRRAGNVGTGDNMTAHD